MKALFDEISMCTSKQITRRYSTSFSLGIFCLNKKMHVPIYAIYGFVRLADEIVDSFQGYDQRGLLSEFRSATDRAIAEGISLNPVLNAFQHTVRQYGIEQELIDCFFASMEMDLDKQSHSLPSYEQYILGSAQVVGLMCLRVFAQGNRSLYDTLKEPAMRLGAAFQKVNFLRDLRDDHLVLGRVYFPGVDMQRFSAEDKKCIEQEIERDFDEALQGIKRLPASSRFGVYTAYIYYRKLFDKIKSISPAAILQSRVRIPDYQKMNLLAYSYLKNSLRMF